VLKFEGLQKVRSNFANQTESGDRELAHETEHDLQIFRITEFIIYLSMRYDSNDLLTIPGYGVRHAKDVDLRSPFC
jgi:hypothetical protein